MRIFILGAGATGSLLAQLLHRHGHIVTCADRDLDRARRFLGKKSPIPLVEVNARNLRAIVRAASAARAQLLLNASPAVFNRIILRAALRLRVHYLDMSSHLSRNPFKPEQLHFAKRFAEKRRAAVINAGAAPGLTNLLAARAAELLDSLDSIHIRLFEETEADDPVSQWSPESSFDEAVSRPRIYLNGRFALAKRFSDRELFRFPPPIGETPVYLAAQDEVATLPRFLPLRALDAKIGGNEIDCLRRWYRQGKLSRSRGLNASRFPSTPTPRQVARLIRRGVLHNARFAIAVIARGTKKDRPVELRWDVFFPSLYQIRLRGLLTTPVAFATAHIAALFIQNFPADKFGVFPPEALPAESRRAILDGVRKKGFSLTLRRRLLPIPDDDF